MVDSFSSFRDSWFWRNHILLNMTFDRSLSFSFDAYWQQLLGSNTSNQVVKPADYCNASYGEAGPIISSCLNFHCEQNNSSRPDYDFRLQDEHFRQWYNTLATKIIGWLHRQTQIKPMGYIRQALHRYSQSIQFDYAIETIEWRKERPLSDTNFEWRANRIAYWYTIHCVCLY